MSCRVAVVMEDHLFDKYVAIPIVERLARELGKPNAKVFAVESPRTQGDSGMFREACRILARYGSTCSAVVFVIDLDGEDGTDGKTPKHTRLLHRVRSCTQHSEVAAVVGATQELEVWALWGCRDELGAAWGDVRREPHPKDVYFEPRLTKGERFSADRGRKRHVSMSLAQSWRSLRDGCPELAELEEQLRRLLDQ